MPDPIVSLKIKGRQFLDWTSISFSHTLESLADSFRLVLVDKEAPPKPTSQTLDIEEGDDCEIRIDGKKVLTGFVDDASIRYGPNQHRIGVAGRSKTGHLVDCSAIYKTGKWRNRTMLQIATNLVSPFGITAAFEIGVTPDLEKFEKFGINEGESAFDVLQRMANARGFLMITDPSGNLKFTRAGRVKAATILQVGLLGNVTNGERRGSWKDRYSQYVVKSQIPGTDQFFGPEAASPVFAIEDEQVKQYRPLIIVPESGQKESHLRNRATWERNTRAGRSRRFIHTSPGWYDKTFLWDVNRLVTVNDPFLKLSKTELLISLVTFSRDESGTRVSIHTLDKKAFDILTQPKPKRKKV